MCAKRINEDDYIGSKYGRLTVVAYKERRGHNIFYECVCECGKTKVTSLSNLKRGNTTSCGCYSDEVRIAVHTTHGKSHTRLYKIWDGIKNRCNHPSSLSYKDYGGR